mmetsp:Transcript_30402/g.48701  ORF Transcript_30402/g.48701 Transcript_30402/m.48701 type:complete len:692 (-) Transcript_30402:58-2133(-)
MNNSHNHNHNHNQHDMHQSSSDADEFEVSSPIPFPQEQDRGPIFRTNAPIAFRSTKSGKSSWRSKRTNADDKQSVYSTLSRRSKSRSPSRSPSQSPISQLSSKMTETHDKIALLGIAPKLQKSAQHIQIRQAMDDAYELKTKHKKRKNKKPYSFLSTLAAPMQPNGNGHTKAVHNTYRSKGGRHRRPFTRNGQSRVVQMYNKRTSALNEFPVSSMSRDGDVLRVSELNRSNYQHLIEESNKKVKKVSKNLDDQELAQFVQETEHRKIQKKMKSAKPADRSMIDLTSMDETERKRDAVRLQRTDHKVIDLEAMDQEDDDIEILNGLQRTSKAEIELNIDVDHYEAKKARERSRRRFDDQIDDDILDTKIWGTECDDIYLQLRTKYLHKKEEQELRRKEEQERLRREKELLLQQQREAEQAEQDAEAMEVDDTAANLLRARKLLELDADDETIIDSTLELPASKIVGTHQGSNIDVKVKDLQTLCPATWLNDEIMNFYMALLQDRNIKRCQENPEHCRVLLMNTFFFTKLQSNGYNYKAVKRWTKKVKLTKKGLQNIETIFDLDKFIFPVHVSGVHWCCGCINFSTKTFEYYDSMNGSSSTFFKVIRKYILDEHEDKLKGDQGKFGLNLMEWTDDNNRDRYPQQENGYDCGVFTSKCADWISDDLYPDYSQENMELFRQRMMVDIIRGKTIDF